MVISGKVKVHHGYIRECYSTTFLYQGMLKFNMVISGYVKVQHSYIREC